jgi:SAM-dependent methyltransferase
MVVGDLGPGAGHFTIRLARAVAPSGVVYALDASRDTLDDLDGEAAEAGITNLRAVRVPRDRLEIPQPVDLLFVSATYNHLPNPSSYFAAARAHFRPGGRLAILEARREGLLARWLAPHASSPHRVLLEMTDAGYRLLTTHDTVRGHWFAEFVVAN